jgi:hypothetical protein
MVRPSTTATKTPQLKDTTTSISRYPMAEFTPKSANPSIIAADHPTLPLRTFSYSRSTSICNSGVLCIQVEEGP